MQLSGLFRMHLMRDLRTAAYVCDVKDRYACLRDCSLCFSSTPQALLKARSLTAYTFLCRTYCDCACDI